MSKVTLSPATTIDNTLLTTINNNNTAITNAINNTISRDGSTPNQMNAAIDMNSNPLINVPFASLPNEPVVLGQLTNIGGNLPVGFPSLVGDVSGVVNTTTGQVPTTIGPGIVTGSKIAATTVTGSNLVNNTVTNTQLAQMSAHTYKGNNTASISNPIDITNTQLTADLNQFTTTLQGVVPGSGGGTANFLRADGTWTSSLQPGSTTTITAGYTITSFNAGNITTGILTPTATNSNYQFYTNNGAHTLAAPTSDCAIDILITNGATAGAITFSGFTVGANTGDVLTTTNASKFIISIRRINSISTYVIKALQ